MKKYLLTTIALISGALYFVACNKGDDNPYGTYNCTCIVSKYYIVYSGPDTLKKSIMDTVYLKAENMDYKSAEAFCNKAKSGYTDTLGSSAACELH